MKLAEALILQASRNKRLEMLRERLVRVAKVQEGDRPAEDPSELLDEVERTTADLTRLIRQINRTNTTHQLADGRTLADAIADRDGLRLRHSIINSLLQAAVIKQDRLSRRSLANQVVV